MRILAILCLFVNVHSSSAGSILALYSHDERSHIFSMMPFLQRLALDGHDITIVDACGDAKPVQPPFPAKVVHVITPTDEASLEHLFSALWNLDPHSWVLGLIHLAADHGFQDFSLKFADKLTQVLNENYDLVVVDEIFSIHGMAIADVLKRHHGIPYVIFVTANIGAEGNMAEIALGHSFVADSTHGTPLPSGHGDVYNPKSFYSRLMNTLETVGEYASLAFIVPHVIRYKGPAEISSSPFSTYDVIRNAEITFRESFDRLGRIAPVAEDFRGIGSHCLPDDTALSRELRDFVEDPTSKGTIYIAFGSIVNFDHCPEAVFNAIFTAIDKFSEYRVIMSMRVLKQRHLPQFNEHVKILNWAPQRTILNHNKTVLFMSHGGLKSYKEAVCSQTPVVFLPILAEQGMIARMSMKAGIATTLNKYTITTEKIVNAFHLVLDDPSYATNMRKFHDFFLDRIMPSLDEASWTVSRFFRRTEKLRSVSRRSHDSVMFFTRKGINLQTLSFFYGDWILAFVSLLYLCSG